MASRLIQPLYESQVVMELHRSPRIEGRTWVEEPAGKPTESSDESFLATQMNIVGSSETRRGVIEKLGLESRWNMTAEECDRKLAGMVGTEPLPGESMIRLVVRSPDPAEAVELANSMADAYITRRKEAESDRIQLLFQTLAHVSRGQQQEADRAEETWRAAAHALGVEARSGGEDSAASIPLAEPPGTDPAQLADLRHKEAHARRAAELLGKIQEDKENARLANLHPLKPATIHETPKTATTPVWPDIRFWSLMAAASVILGACAIGWGWQQHRTARG